MVSGGGGGKTGQGAVAGLVAEGGGRWHGREVHVLGLELDCVRILELRGPEFKSLPSFPTFLSPNFLTCQMEIITSLSYATMNVRGSVS